MLQAEDKLLDPHQNKNAPEPEPSPNSNSNSNDLDQSEGFQFDEEQIEEIQQLLDHGEFQNLSEKLLDMHAADKADLIELLDPSRRKQLIGVLRVDFDSDILTYLDEDLREDIVELLKPEELAAAVAELETDDAVDLIEDLDPEEQQAVLDSLPESDRALVQEGLTYPEDSAGRMMQREIVTVPEFWTVGKTMDYLRETQDDLPDDFYDLFVVDPMYKLKGSLPLSRVMRHRRSTQLGEIDSEDIRSIKATTDQEEVAYLFRKYGLVSAPVVDENGRILGAITVDDVVDVIEEEHEEDILKLGGVEKDDFYQAVWGTTRSRFAWLGINLFTAIVASLAIGMFEATLQEVVALAVLMPIVASMGGNAGTQTLTVAVRALATKELTGSNAWRIIGKETLVGTLNGLAFAVIGGIIAAVWFGSPGIGGVIAGAMVINLLFAGLFGAIIPIALERWDIDPAVSSSIFLTTVTDVVGFVAFLGLATWFLL